MKRVIESVLQRRLLTFVSFLLVTLVLVACGTAKRVTVDPPISSVPVGPDQSLVTLEVDTVSISFDNMFTDGAGAFSYSIESNQNPNVVVPSIQNNKFMMQLKGVGSSEIVFKETQTGGTTALASLTVTVTESATAGQAADVQLKVGSNFLADSAAGFSYALAKNTNASVLSPQIANNSLTLDFLAEGSASITIDETGPDGIVRPATFTVSGSQGETNFPRIEFTSDRSLVFSESGQTGQLAAVVFDENGNLIPDAQINWTSSRPEMVEVSSTGLVTTKVTLGSATITASFGELRTTAEGDSEIPDETATIVIANLEANTKLIDSSNVLSIDVENNEVILSTNAITKNIQPGDIIITGDLGGLYVRVLTKTELETNLIFGIELVNVGEGLKDLDISVFGATRNHTIDFTANGETLSGEIVTLSPQRFSLSDLTCVNKGSKVKIKFEASSINTKITLSPNINYRSGPDGVELFELFFVGSLSFKATTGKVSAGVNGTIECSIKLPGIPIAFVPIIGPIGIGSDLVPQLGTSFAFDTTLVKLQGPTYERGVELTGGIHWDNINGFSTITSSKLIGKGLTWDFLEGEGITVALKGKIEPFFALIFRESLKIGPFEVIGFDSLRFKLVGGGSLELKSPFLPSRLGYTGPTFSLYQAGALDLDPLLKELNIVQRALNKMRIPIIPADKISASLVLKKYEVVFYKSPKPTIETTTTSINREERTAGLLITAEASDGAKVEFIAFKDGDESNPITLNTTTMSENTALFEWSPSLPSEPEVYKIVARVDGNLILPHGSKTPVTITVGGDEPPPPPPPAPEPQCTEEGEEGENTCGNSWGDPHLTTFDELDYDFQATGDYILTKATDSEDDFEIQIRYRPTSLSSGVQNVSYGNALAMNVAGDIVELYLDSSANLQLVLNGQSVIFNNDIQALGGGGIVDLDSLRGKVIWPDGTTINVESFNSNVHGVFLSVYLTMPNNRKNKLVGLLGNFDGNPDNDLQLRDGTAVPIRNQDIYGNYRNDWRVPVGEPESLFTQGTELFDPLFPSEFITLDSLDTDARAAARQVCIDSGVVDPDKLDACTLDVALTGESSFAQAAKRADNTIVRVNVSPSSAILAGGQIIDFESSILADPTAKILWSVSAGTIQELTNSTIRYTAPTAIGNHTITATLESDSTISTTVNVVVKSFSKNQTANSVVFFKDTFYRVYNEDTSGVDAVYFEESSDGATWSGKTLVSPSGNTTNKFTEGTIAAWEKGGVRHIAIAYIQSAASSSFGGGNILYAQSNNGGLSFSNPSAIVLNNHADSRFLPHLIVDSDKFLHLYWTANNTRKGYSLTSSSNGQSWPRSPIGNVFGNITTTAISTTAVGSEGGDRWLVTSNRSGTSTPINIGYFNNLDAGGSGQITLSNPDHTFRSSPNLKFGAGVLYATFNVDTGSAISPFIAKSLDKGLTWSEPIQISNTDQVFGNRQSPNLVVGADNRLHAIWADYQANVDELFENIYISSSSNQGDTWSSSVQINSSAINSIVSDISVAIDDSVPSKLSLNYVETKQDPSNQFYFLVHNEFITP